MKHLKIYENLNVSTFRNMVTNYRNMLSDMEPYIFEKYYKLAEDPNYEPNYGTFPNIDANELQLEAIGYFNTGFQFVLHSYDNDGDIDESYYIELDESEVEEIFIKINSKKYNL